MKSKKSKLNQRHWLNIMIFSVSCMLLLSVLVGRMMNPVVETVSLDNENQLINALNITATPILVDIIQLDFGEIQFIKTSNQWHSSNTQFSVEQIMVIANSWQSLLLQSGTKSNQKNNTGKTVLIYLANLSHPLIVKVSLVKNELIIYFIKQELEFKLASKDLSFYYPQLDQTK